MLAVGFVAAFVITTAFAGSERALRTGGKTVVREQPSGARPPDARRLRRVAALPDLREPRRTVSARGGGTSAVASGAPPASAPRVPASPAGVPTRSAIDAGGQAPASPAPTSTASPPTAPPPAPTRPPPSSRPPSVAPTPAPGFDSSDGFDSSG
jgi:hypothetical protein